MCLGWFEIKPTKSSRSGEVKSMLEVSSAVHIPSSADCVKLTRNAVNPCKHPAIMGNSGFFIFDVICTKT